MRVSSYRTDEGSEKRVSTYNTAIAIIVIFFIVILALCIWKIKQYNKSIQDSKAEILEQKDKLASNNEEIMRLRLLKIQSEKQNED